MADTPPKTVRCPRCATPAPWQGNPFRPFCSEKCRMVDLGRWAEEEYRVAAEKVDPEQLNNLIPFPEK